MRNGLSELPSQTCGLGQIHRQAVSAALIAGAISAEACPRCFQPFRSTSSVGLARPAHRYCPEKRTSRSVSNSTVRIAAPRTVCWIRPATDGRSATTPVPVLHPAMWVQRSLHSRFFLQNEVTVPGHGPDMSGQKLVVQVQCRAHPVFW